MTSADAPSFLVIDFETADPYRDSACLISLVRVEAGQITQQASFFIRPPRSHITLTHIHGIFWDMVKQEPSFAELWPQLQPWFDNIQFLVAHNASFDRSVLRACCESANIPVPPLEFQCTMKLARDTWDIRPTDLPNVCKHLGIPLQKQNYLANALACTQVFLTWQSQQPELSEQTDSSQPSEQTEKAKSTKRAKSTKKTVPVSPENLHAAESVHTYPTSSVAKSPKAPSQEEESPANRSKTKAPNQEEESLSNAVLSRYLRELPGAGAEAVEGFQAPSDDVHAQVLDILRLLPNRGSTNNMIPSANAAASATSVPERAVVSTTPVLEDVSRAKVAIPVVTAQSVQPFAKSQTTQSPAFAESQTAQSPAFAKSQTAQSPAFAKSQTVQSRKSAKKTKRGAKKSTRTIQYSLSPSRLARFFYHDCERYLRYHITPEAHREELEIPDIPYEYNPMMQIMRERGFRWEEKSLRAMQKDRNILIAPGEGELHTCVHSWSETLQWFRTLSVGEGIYQPTLIIPPRFLARYGIDEEQVNFPACRPDLLLAEPGEQGIKIRVIDMKASPALKTSHRIQVALYALLLRDIFVEEQLSLHIDLEEAGVWLYEQPTPSTFSLTTSCRILDDFLRHRLREILLKPIQQVPWHLQFRCEWCEFFVHCRQQADQERDVSLIPYLSSGGRQYLRDALQNEGATVQSLDDLEQLLQRADAAEILGRCGSLSGQEERLAHAVTALKQEQVVNFGCSSPSFPIREHVRLMLTLQSDQLSGQVYAAGFRRMMGKDVYKEGSSVHVFVADKPEQCKDVRAKFVHALYQEMIILHEHNRGKVWKEQKTLQCYVFDSYEKKLLNELLLEALRDPELAPEALPLLFYFQSESLVEAEHHPVSQILYPLIVLTEAIRELVALPHPLVVRLQDALRSLPSPTFGYAYEQSDLLCMALGNALKSDAIYLAWEKENDQATGWIEQELQKRLIATSVVIDGLRQQVQAYLVVWPAKFLFPDQQKFQHPEISRLAFITRYESLMGALEVRTSRSLPYAERLREGLTIPLHYRGSQQWDVLSTLEETVLRSDHGMFERLLTPTGMEGEKLQIGYDDYAYREAWGPPRGPLHFASLLDFETDPTNGKVKTIQLAVKTHSTQLDPQPGDKALLYPRYTDFTSTKILSYLTQLDHNETSDFLALLRNPVGFAIPLNVPRKQQDKAIKSAKKAGMTSSQFRAFEKMLAQRFTLVWGPPGTGKTHFLAQAIWCFLSTLPPDTPPLRIAITAFTHAAIENLLGQMQELVSANPTSLPVWVCKWGKPVTLRGEHLPWITDKKTQELPDVSVHYFVGGTVYGLSKAFGKHLDACDILLVDEGSQLKLAELALVLQMLKPQGRLVVAGDDLQLPPILQGVYPDSPDGLPGLHDSVFAYLRARDNPADPYTCQLLENWRMNTTLCRFSADTLYGPQYQPASPSIAKQTLQLPKFSYQPILVKDIYYQTPTPFCAELPELVTWLLDPEWPLVTCVLEDTTETVENPIEAEVLAHLSVALRQHLYKPGTKKPYPSTSEGDREFWRKSLCIVSPHHLQIRAIRRSLDVLYSWQSPPFVDTVDKMQGQQADAVFVSYGVSDMETALAEAEFIYSLHRLNVSVTRAKAKCLVCLPRPLLQSSFELLHNEKATQGLGHMHALLAFCREFGQTKEFVFTGTLSHRRSRITSFRAKIDT